MCNEKINKIFMQIFVQNFFKKILSTQFIMINSDFLKSCQCAAPFSLTVLQVWDILVRTLQFRSDVTKLKKNASWAI